MQNNLSLSSKFLLIFNLSLEQHGNFAMSCSKFKKAKAY